MKNKLLLSLIVSLFAVSAAWADTSVVERFSQVGEILNNDVSKTEIRTVNGDLCQWEHRGNRRDTTTDGFSDKMASGKLGWWTSGNNSDNLLRTKDAFEGGVKQIDLEWKQFSTAVGATVVVDVIVGATTFHPINYTGGNASTTVATTDQHASFDCNIKQNAQINVTNLSTTTNKAGRILIGDITITPYLLYTQKKVVVGLSQTGYINNGLIDNTEGEGTISYSSSAESVATVTSSGVIEPKAVGKTTITATWEGVTTSYELIVANTAVETFDTKDGSVTNTYVTSVTTKECQQASWTFFSGGILKNLGNMGLENFAGIIRAKKSSESTYPYFQSNTIEGGIRDLQFTWNSNGNETGGTWNVRIYVNDTELDAVTGPGGPKSASPFNMYCVDNIGVTDNYVIKFVNESPYDGTSNSMRFVFDNLTIVPYLLYTTKEATLDLRNNVYTYTNTDIVNNTTGDAPVYSINPNDVSGVTFTSSNGQVDIDPNADVQGDFVITASWGSVSTSYTLHVTSRAATAASFATPIVPLVLGAEVPANTLTPTTEGYAAEIESESGVISYESNNTEVAIVASNGAVSLAGGVGQATITATLPQTANFKGTTASYIIQVTDNSANQVVETFSAVTNGNAAAHTDKTWDGDLFDWYTTEYGGVRKNGDKFPSDNTTEHTGIWMGIPEVTSTYATLQSKKAVEGGIKYMSFYWEQWGTESEHILNPVVYIKTGDNEPVQKASVEYMPTGSPVAANRMLIGINDVRSNSQLIIRNESHKSDGSRVNGQGRIILDEIHITPYLLYTTKEAELDLRNASTYTNTDLINNIENGSITYSLENNDEEASIDPASGEVTGIKAGQVTVKATWSEDAYTTYTLNIVAATETEASFESPNKRISLEESVDNNLNITTEGYEDELASEMKTIAYSSSNSAVASYSAGVWTINGVGQTTITASLPATANFTAAEASFILQVTDNSTDVQVEAFSNVEKGNADKHAGKLWSGDVYDWRVSSCGGVRKNADKFASDQTREGIWMGTPDDNSNYSSLTVENGAEGGIKHIWFYCEQPYNTGETGYTLKPVIYLNSAQAANKVSEVEVVGTSGATSIAANRTLFGASNVTKSNSVLIIRNESYQTDGGARPDNNRGRILLDSIYITPWLLYTDKAERVLRIGETTKNESLINTIGEAASFESSDPNVASVASDGTVRAKASGKVTITAKYQWNENEVVTTTYPVAVYPVNCETFDGIEQTGNYSNTTPREGDKATWTTSLGGFNVGDCAALTTNLVRFRAPNNTDENAFIESSSIAGGIGAMTFDWNLGGNESTTEWDIRVFINGQLVKTLTNAEISATGAMNHFEQIAIEGINEPGNFVIRFENHSTISGTYPEGNKARFLMDNITWTSYEGTKTLAEDTNNEGWIRANGGQTRDVIISRSALVGGVWNTLCLPFAISKADDLDNAEVVEMTNVEQNGDEIDITFTAISGDELAGGMPYLVRPAADKNISGTYENKVIAMIASPVVQGIVTMQGMFSPVSVTKDDYNTLFVGTPDGEGNNLFYPQADGTLRGLRAYFKLITATPMTAPLRRARYVINQKDVETGIESVQNSDVRIQKIIRDGQLFIIHDGKMYNAQGQVIK